MPQRRLRGNERLGWFAECGVQECWLVRRLAREIEVIGFAERAIVARQGFTSAMPMRSAVPPGFDRTPAAMLLSEL